MRFIVLSRLMLLYSLLPFLSLHAIDTQAAFESRPTYLVINMPNTPDMMPRNFRLTSSPYKFSTSKVPTRQGLDLLNASGSGQFSQNGLKTLLSHLKKPAKLIIVDLRQESHGFVNGIAISWFAPKNWINAGKTQKQVEEDENRRLAGLLKAQQIVLNTVVKKNIDGTIARLSEQTIHPLEVSNEFETTKRFNVDYFRICVTDHLRPSDQDVERFIKFVTELEPKTWLHFHCDAGEGRTTTFLAMYDMWHHAKDISFDDIIKRQYLIGGHDLAKMPDLNSWKYPLAAERLFFLQQFYEYCRTKAKQPQHSWMAHVNQTTSK